MEVKDTSGKTVLTIPDSTFAAGELYSVFVVPGSADGPPEAFVTADTKDSLTTRVIGGVGSATEGGSSTSGTGVEEDLLDSSGTGESLKGTSGTGTDDELLPDSAGSGALPSSILLPFGAMVVGATLTIVGALMALLGRWS